MKTYLAPKQQVEKTILHFSHLCEIGQIVRPHRLFLPGDIVFVDINNGQASRFPICCISGKGYRITNYYIHFQSFWFNGEKPRNRIFEFIELPNYLSSNDLINNSDARQWLISIAEGGRARYSAIRVSANSPKDQ